MTYEEKVAELERLHAEVAGKPQILGSWEAASSILERSEEPDEVAPVLPMEPQKRNWRSIPEIAPGARAGRGGLPEDFIEKMYRFYLFHRSIAKTAERFGRTRQSVWEMFKRRGLKLRKDSKARARVKVTRNGVRYAPGKGGDATCHFRVNAMLVERLVAHGFLRVRHGSNRFVTEYGLPENLIERAA